MSISHALKGLISAAAMTAATIASASAGTLYVVGDVNAFSFDSQGLLDQLLADSPTIGAVTGSTVSAGDFLSNPAVDAVFLPDFSAASLGTIDFLTVGTPTRFPGNALSLTAQDTANVADFLNDGGDVLLYVETTTSTGFNSYNSFLEALGSTIRFTGARANFRENFGEFFQCNACNVLEGGVGLAVFEDGEFAGQFAAASETFGSDTNPVPVPGALPLFLAGAAAFGAIKRRRAALAK